VRIFVEIPPPADYAAARPASGAQRSVLRGSGRPVSAIPERGRFSRGSFSSTSTRGPAGSGFSETSWISARSMPLSLKGVHRPPRNEPEGDLPNAAGGRHRGRRHRFATLDHPDLHDRHELFGPSFAIRPSMMVIYALKLSMVSDLPLKLNV